MYDLDAFFAIICLVAVAAIFYGPWQSLCIEYARQVIFEERERLFDLAADGRMDFESVEYRELRDFLNKSIRFSHDITLWRFAVNRSFMRAPASPSAPPSVGAMMKSIGDPETRKAIERILDRSTAALVVAMVCRSLPAAALAIVMALASYTGLRKGLMRKFRRVERAVQRDVEFAPM